MKSLLAAAIVIVLSGCSATMVQGNANVVQFEHFDNPAGFKSAMAEAAKACAVHGRIAALDRRICPGMNCVTQFRCE